MNFRFRGKGGRAADITGTTEFDPACVKTHTIAKCRKYNSPTRYRTSCAQHDSTPLCAIASRCFYVRGGRWSFRTAKTQLRHRPDRNSAAHRNLAVSAASPAAATQFGSVPGFSPSAQSQRPAAAGLSRDGSNKATIAAFLAQQARSFEISLLRARNQQKIPDHRLENRDTDGGRKEAQ